MKKHVRHHRSYSLVVKLLLLSLFFCNRFVALADSSLQQALDRLTPSTNVTEFNLSQYSSTLSETLYIRGGISVRFVNGTLTRGEDMKLLPLIEIKDGSSLELGAASKLRGEGYQSVVLVSDGELTIRGGSIDGSPYNQENQNSSMTRRKTKSDSYTIPGGWYDIYVNIAVNVEMASQSGSAMKMESGTLTGNVVNKGNNTILITGGSIDGAVRTTTSDIFVGSDAHINQVILDNDTRIGLVSGITNELPVKGVTAGEAAVYGKGYTLTWDDRNKIWFMDDYNAEWIGNTIVATEWGTDRYVEGGKVAYISPHNQEITEYLAAFNNLNGSDIAMIRNLGNKALKKLELSHTRIVSGGSSYFTQQRPTKPGFVGGVFTYDRFYTEEDTISYHMFGELTSLESITLPVGVRVIENEAFINCENLKEIKEVSSSVREIGGSAFIGCTSLTDCSFQYNNYLTNENGVIYDKDMTKIHAALPAVVSGEYILPNTVEEINGHAFFGSKDLKRIGLEASAVTTIYASTFSGCTALGETKLPKEVKKVEANAFYNCALTHLTLPESLLEIGVGAFAMNPITEIHCQSPVPPTIQPFSPTGDFIWPNYTTDGTFEGIDTLTCKVYVPKASIEAYKNAPGWSSFQNYVEDNSTSGLIATVDDLQAKLDEIAAKGLNEFHAETVVLDDNGVLVDKPLYVRNGCMVILTGGPLRLQSNSGQYCIEIDNKSYLYLKSITVDMMNNDFQYNRGIIYNSGTLRIGNSVYDWDVDFINVPKGKGNLGECLFHMASGSVLYYDTPCKIITEFINVFKADEDARLNLWDGEFESFGVSTIDGWGNVQLASTVYGGGKFISIVKAKRFGGIEGQHTIVDRWGSATYIEADDINIGMAYMEKENYGGNGIDIVIGKTASITGRQKVPTLYLKQDACITITDSPLQYDWTLNGRWSDFTLGAMVVKNVQAEADFERMTFINMPEDREAWYDEAEHCVRLRKISEDGIEKIEHTASSIKHTVYDVQGRKMENDDHSRGLRLQRMSDGTVRKMIKY